MTSNLKAKKLFPITLLIAAILLLSSTFGALLAGASASSGIKNNGTDGININIYGTYYKTLAKQTSCAYARGGCAWYASARASELVGRNLGLHSPDNWWSTYAASNGFKKSSSPVAKGFAVFSNHIVVVENVCGTTLTVSEGSNPSASDADHGYCVIRKVERSTFEKSNYKGQSFRGYIDLGVRMNNPPIAETVPRRLCCKRLRRPGMAFLPRKYTGLYLYRCRERCLRMVAHCEWQCRLECQRRL